MGPDGKSIDQIAGRQTPRGQWARCAAGALVHVLHGPIALSASTGYFRASAGANDGIAKWN